MSIEANLKYAFGWNHYTIMYMGIWPENRSFSQASSYKVIVPILTMFCFCCAPQSANLPLIWGDFDLVVDNLSTGNITITISLLKTIIFWSSGRSLKTLVSGMTKDWTTTVNKRDRRTMLGIASITRKLSIRSTVFVQIVVTTFIVSRFVAIQQTGRQLFLRAYFPYNATRSPSYELTLFGQYIALMYASITYTAVDTFIATLVLHTCGQLSNLRRELTNLRACTKAEFQTKLGYIARKHECLNRRATMLSYLKILERLREKIVLYSLNIQIFAETIEDSFNMMLLMQMMGCSLQLCFQCLQTFMSMMGEVDEVFIFQFTFLSIYVAYILLQLYLYCYIGEKLLVESTEIAYAAYDCSWYNLSAREARSLMIIMCRARTPLHITAGRFCSFNRELYGEVLKRSVAYMSCFYAANSFE